MLAILTIIFSLLIFWRDEPTKRATIYNILWYLISLGIAIFSACGLMLSLETFEPRVEAILFTHKLIGLNVAVVSYATTIHLRARADVLNQAWLAKGLYIAVVVSVSIGASVNYLSLFGYVSHDALIFLELFMGLLTVAFDLFFCNVFWRGYKQHRIAETSDSLDGILNRFNLMACVGSSATFLAGGTIVITRGVSTRSFHEMGLTMAFVPAILLVLKKRMREAHKTKFGNRSSTNKSANGQ